MCPSPNLVDNIYVDRLESYIFIFYRRFFDFLEKTSNVHILDSKFFSYDSFISSTLGKEIPTQDHKDHLPINTHVCYILVR